MNPENTKVRGQRLFIAAARQLITMIGTALILYGLIWVFPIGATPNSQPESPVASSLTIVPYTGTLTDQNGNPINGSRTIQFSLWNLPTGGIRLWPTSGTSESHTVNVQDGQFHVNLGSTSGNGIPDTIGGQDLWLQIQVGNEILQPRQQIGVAFNAIESLNAQNVPDASISSRKLIPILERISVPTSVALTVTPQTVASATVEVEVPSHLWVIVTCDCVVSNGAFVGGAINIDGVYTPGHGFYAGFWPVGNNNSVALRQTVSNQFVYDLDPGTHTIEMKASLVNGVGSATVEYAHSGFSYLLVAR